MVCRVHPLGLGRSLVVAQEIFKKRLTIDHLRILEEGA